ncbi:hypothetical protein T492DRAFT_833224 [Pavlovales sp. CCMP2436]|nr:hypothetical protein T492DRAFT_833224 [Pavlovales sp. CCMP2436]
MSYYIVSGDNGDCDTSCPEFPRNSGVAGLRGELSAGGLHVDHARENEPGPALLARGMRAPTALVAALGALSRLVATCERTERKREKEEKEKKKKKKDVHLFVSEERRVGSRCVGQRHRRVLCARAGGAQRGNRGCAGQGAGVGGGGGRYNNNKEWGRGQ